MQVFKPSFKYASIMLAAFGLDRVSKWFILNYLPADPFTVFPNLNFVILWNRGVSFSFLHFDSAVGFWLLNICIMLVVAFFGLYTYKQHIVQVKPIGFEMLVIGGALSNIIDRFIYGGVLDFIDFYYGSWHFATFNLADAFVFVGMVGLMSKLYSESHGKVE